MKRLLLPLVLLGTAFTASAQVGEVWLSFGKATMRNNELGGFTDTTTGSTLFMKSETGFRLSPRFAINSWRFMGHEFGYAYNRGKLLIADQEFGSMNVHQGFYNFLVYATPEGTRIRPFGTGGVHFSSFYPSALGSSVFSGNGVTKFGINYGGGIKVRVGEIFGFRVDVRDYLQGKPDFAPVAPEGWIKQLEVSAGFGLMF